MTVTCADTLVIWVVFLCHSFRLDAVSAVNALRSVVSLFGSPSRIIADQGRCFDNKDFRDLCDSHSVQLHLIATGTSRGNGQVERVMGTLKNMLTAVETSGSRSWQDALGDVQLAINCTMNRTTNASPLELLIGKVARPLSLLPLCDEEREVDLTLIRKEAADLLQGNAHLEKIRFDEGKATILKFVAGDFVLIKNHERNQTKLDPKFKGPFKVVEVLSNDRYLLKSLDSNRFYKYAHDRLRAMPDSTVPVELDVCDGDS